MTKYQAIKILFDVSDDTVIDNTWYDSLIESDILCAMFIVSGLTNYKKILEKHEGDYIDEFLNTYLNV